MSLFISATHGSVLSKSFIVIGYCRKMALEFIVFVDRAKYPKSQVNKINIYNTSGTC